MRLILAAEKELKAATALSASGRVLAIGYNSIIRIDEYQNLLWVPLGSPLQGQLNVAEDDGGDYSFDPQVCVALAENALVLAIGDPMRRNETGHLERPSEYPAVVF